MQRWLLLLLTFPISHATINIRGLNWFGLETDQHALEGLYAFPVRTHVQRMASFGFNTLRVPFAMEGVISGLYRETGAYDTLHDVFKACDEHNMSVVLDLHRLFFHTTSPLWHSSLAVTVRETNVSVVMSETNVLAGWKVVLSAFRGYSSLMGIDLYNEPHGDASFHTGNRSTDFQLFVERAVEELGEWTPKIFITGIHWGQDMRAYDALNVSQEKIVMAPHVYGPALTPVQGGDAWKTDPSILEYRWNHYFGYLATKGWTIVVGEFGASEYNPDDMIWLSHFANFLKKHSAWGWMYWAWNPGSHDVQGFLEWDWKTPVPSKFKILSKLLDAPPP